MPRIRVRPFHLRRTRHRRRRRLLPMLLPVLLILILLTPLYLIYKPPSLLIHYLSTRYPDVIWHVPSPHSNSIALTIDDAPSDHTPDILTALAEHGARATFFIIGSQVAGREALLAEIVARGHELGNHGWRDEPATSLPTPELARQIVAVEGLIADAYAAARSVAPARDHPSGLGAEPHRSEPPRFYRPGSGFFSRRMRELAKDLGYRVALGSVYPHDAQIPYAWVNARHVLSMLRPGAVMICHDRRAWTAPMLKRVLPEMKSRGWEVKTLSDLLK